MENNNTKQDKINFNFKDKTILITGGTGFLGKTLTEEILKQEPKAIRIFSRDEYKHHKFMEYFGKDNQIIRNLIGDVRDYNRLIEATEGVDIVIHAAASKRIDILEYNVQEAINTNVSGTVNVANACLNQGVKKAVFVSTDKACYPINTYGTCKYLGERYFIERNYNKGGKNTVFTAVRYGNVFGSTGSFVPEFEEKIKKNKKMQLTDERMTRFVISKNQAVQLIFDAIEYGIGGEIFIPKIPAIKLTDLIEILNKKHNLKAQIEYTGIRPGEKLHELMINEYEISRTHEFKDMYIIISQIEKYQKLKEIPKYICEGNKLDERIKEYSSKDTLLSLEQATELFKKLQFI